jgi:hypothetical protein
MAAIGSTVRYFVQKVLCSSYFMQAKDVIVPLGCASGTMSLNLPEHFVTISSTSALFEAGNRNLVVNV